MTNTKTKPIIYINPPPMDKRCMRCGKHIDELLPFGKAGDPLVGSFEGALLVKTFRGCIDPIERMEKLAEEFEGMMPKGIDVTDEIIDDIIKKMVVLHPDKLEDINELMTYSELTGTISASWECRDCIITY